MNIGFIGNGWRTQGYWKIIHECGEMFHISGVLFRNEEKAAAFTEAKAFTDIEAFLRQDHDMIFILLPRHVVLPYIERCVQAGFPVLVETPPGNGVEELRKVWEMQQKYRVKIQVAEQYFLQPYHRAVQALVDAGLLGEISNLRISMAHDYHGISVMRRLLGVGESPCTIHAQEFQFPVLYHCGREGLTPDAAGIRTDSRKVATFDFDGKVGFFDFAGEQYFNYFRGRELNVQGTHGEINGYHVSYWSESGPLAQRMERQDLGNDSNLEGYFHRGITFGGKFLYENPLAPARLTDDEIAMGSLLLGMQEMLRTGREIYPLREALQDTYLYLMMDEAIRNGAPVKTELQPWNTEN